METIAAPRTTAPQEPALAFFGLSATASLRELRAAYYEMALLCHPDRGGDAPQMRAVCAHYENAKTLLGFHAESVARMQQHEQSNHERPDAPPSLPTFLEIFEETHEQFNQRFNASFEAEQQQQRAPDPFQTQGYGEYLLPSGEEEREPPSMPPRALVCGGGVDGCRDSRSDAAGCIDPPEHIDDFTLCTPALRMQDYRYATTDADTTRPTAPSPGQWLHAHMPRHLHALARQRDIGSNELCVRVPNPAPASEVAHNNTATWRSIAVKESLSEAEMEVEQLWRELEEPEHTTREVMLRVRSSNDGVAPDAGAAGDAEDGGADAELCFLHDDDTDARHPASLTKERVKQIEERWADIQRENPEFEWVDRLVQEVVHAFVYDV